MYRAVLGLDIGGANLKAAQNNGVARSVPFALWKAPHELAGRLRELIATMPSHELIAMTMTGELCDCFASKAEGVRAILRAVREATGLTTVLVWTTHGRFENIDLSKLDPQVIAAANWHALATHVARYFADSSTALLIDVGTTTTDITYLKDGRPHPRGLTDPARLACGELVYTGVRRTPVCAVLGMEVAAEFFATMLDVYLLLELIEENPHDLNTADGRPAMRSQAHARLARLRCADVDEFPLAEASALAQRALARQVEFVGWAIDTVLRERTPPEQVILVGSGEALGRAVCATHARLRGVRVVSLAEVLGAHLSAATCAFAVARLASEDVS